MSEETADISVEEMSTLLRKLYARHKQIRERKPYRPHKRHDGDTHWKKTAELVLRLKADPEDFMDAQFNMRFGPVFANTLWTPTAEKAYKSYKFAVANKNPGRETSGVIELKQRRAGVLSMVHHHTGKRDAETVDVIAEFLANPYMYDPLLVMLMVGDNPDIKEKYNQAAVEDIRENPYLRTAAKKLNLHIEYLDEDV